MTEAVDGLEGAQGGGVGAEAPAGLPLEEEVQGPS